MAEISPPPVTTSEPPVFLLENLEESPGNTLLERNRQNPIIIGLLYMRHNNLVLARVRPQVILKTQPPNCLDYRAPNRTQLNII